MSNAHDPHADAWAFVLRHRKMINRLSFRFAGPVPAERREEWVRDVYVRIVEKFPKYDPAKSAPQTWIVWQMRAVSTQWARRFQKRVREGYGSDKAMLLIPLGHGDFGSEEHADALATSDDASTTVFRLYNRATPEQRVAIRTYLAGMKAAELRAKHGMTNRQRLNHLRALRAHAQE